MGSAADLPEVAPADLQSGSIVGILLLFWFIGLFVDDVQSPLHGNTTRSPLAAELLPENLDLRTNLTNTWAIGGSEEWVGGRECVELLPFPGESLDASQRPLLRILTRFFTQRILDDDCFER